MQITKSLHTLNARGNIMLELIRDHLKVSPANMHREIQTLRRSVEDALSLKGVSYDKLKTALVPDIKRKEMALIFDTTAIANSWYGIDVFKQLIPLFDLNSNHSILCGDDIGSNKNQGILRSAMIDDLKQRKEFVYKHSSQFYIVYINNLTQTMVDRFDGKLNGYLPYVGYVDTTYGSAFKFFISTMLVNLCVKHGKIIIQGHEDDRDLNEDVNMCAYPFEEYGYICRSIPSYLEGMFLSYKIERPVVAGFEVDTEFSLNAISTTPLPLSEFTVEVEEAKLGYLREVKSGSLTRAGLEAMSSSQLAKLIMGKISASYIYNMAFDVDHNIAKFNIIIEIPGSKNIRAARLLAALEYKADNKVLRLITFY